MKIQLATVGLFTALTVAACSGGGHSDSYNKGYKYGQGFANSPSSQFSDPGMYCGAMSVTQAEGLDKDEWLKGCADGASKK